MHNPGWTLIAVGLILLMFLGTTPSLRVPWPGTASYLLVAIGGMAVVLYKCMEIIQYSHLRKRTALCESVLLTIDTSLEPRTFEIPEAQVDEYQMYRDVLKSKLSPY